MKNSDIVCLTDYKYRPVSMEILKALPEDDNRDIANWLGNFPFNNSLIMYQYYSDFFLLQEIFGSCRDSPNVVRESAVLITCTWFVQISCSTLSWLADAWASTNFSESRCNILKGQLTLLVESTPSRYAQIFFTCIYSLLGAHARFSSRTPDKPCVCVSQQSSKFCNSAAGSLECSGKVHLA